ncbi:Uncharacterised protein [Bordetella pertussis]|nr:Uncharacterised protein [Bordetella pertussis]
MPRSSRRRNSTGLSTPARRARSYGRSRRDCSRIASGPCRAPTRNGCVPQSNGMPSTQANAASPAGRRAGTPMNPPPAWTTASVPCCTTSSRLAPSDNFTPAASTVNTIMSQIDYQCAKDPES